MSTRYTVMPGTNLTTLRKRPSIVRGLIEHAALHGTPATIAYVAELKACLHALIDMGSDGEARAAHQLLRNVVHAERRVLRCATR